MSSGMKEGKWCPELRSGRFGGNQELTLFGQAVGSVRVVLQEGSMTVNLGDGRGTPHLYLVLGLRVWVVVCAEPDVT